jgi:hypothetical protein
MIMLVSLGKPENNSHSLSNAFLLAITVGPWLVLVWLLFAR